MSSTRRYCVGTIGEFESWTAAANTDETPATAEFAACDVPDGCSAAERKVNRKGRLLIKTPEGRELIVLSLGRDPDAVKKRSEGEKKSWLGSIASRFMGGGSSTTKEDEKPPLRLVAADRNCYHVGYPLDLGALELVEVSDTPTEESSVLPEIEDTARVPCDPAKSRWCINCPLHNRIFDLSSGHMMGYDMATDSDGLATGDVGNTASSRGCRQRLHRVVVEGEESDPASRVFVEDSFANAGLVEKVLVKGGSSGLFVDTAVKVLKEEPGFVISDKYNLPEGDATAPSTTDATATAQVPQAVPPSAGDGDELPVKRSRPEGDAQPPQ